jgi:copper(I)-binding protein
VRGGSRAAKRICYDVPSAARPLQEIMMLRRPSVPAVLLALLAPIGAASAAEPSATIGALQIVEPWTRATPPRAPTGSGYLAIENIGQQSDRLVAIASPRAERVEIHAMTMEGGVMRMRPHAAGLDIPAGETVALTPGGLHLMFMGLTAPFSQGEAVPVTLTFEKAGTVELVMPTMPIGAQAPLGRRSQGQGG